MDLPSGDFSSLWMYNWNSWQLELPQHCIIGLGKEQMETSETAPTPPPVKIVNKKYILS